MILAGGVGDRLSILSAVRAKPAVPFAGRYRIIDFCLSNCANSGIYKVAVLTQYNPRSLAGHIGVGRPWDLDRINGGVTLLQPFQGRGREGWYRGTADAIYQNLDFVQEQRLDQVLVLSGDHIYTMRYDHMVLWHRQKNADITVGVVEVPQEEISRFGILTLDDADRIVNFREKPRNSQSSLASMGIYVFNRDTLIQCLEESARKARGYDFGRDIIPSVLDRHRVFGYKFQGYWRDVGTVEAYWQASMDLLADLPSLDLYDPDLPIRANLSHMPPVKVGPEAQISRSLISNGCIINGEVRNSVLSPGVYVEFGARVVDSVIFADAFVGRDAIVERSIIDKNVWLGPGCHIGYGDDYTPNLEEPRYINTGISLVGKKARIPAGTRIGRNCKIGCWVEMTDFDTDFVPSGASVGPKTPRRLGP
jgi:glucose-1-phosphate adenylyltransferase